MLKKRKKADILSIEEDETHIQVARNLNQTVGNLGKYILPDFWLPSSVNYPQLQLHLDYKFIVSFS